jgi:hypothetical protein
LGRRHDARVVAVIAVVVARVAVSDLAVMRAEQNLAVARSKPDAIKLRRDLSESAPMGALSPRWNVPIIDVCRSAQLTAVNQEPASFSVPLRRRLKDASGAVGRLSSTLRTQTHDRVFPAL